MTMNKDIERFLDLENIEQVLDLAKCTLEKIWQSGIGLRDIFVFDVEINGFKKNKNFDDLADEYFRKPMNDKFKDDSQKVLEKTLEFCRKENISSHAAGYIKFLALGEIADNILLEIMHDNKIKNPIDEISFLLSKTETEKNKYPEFLEVRREKRRQEFENLFEEDTITNTEKPMQDSRKEKSSNTTAKKPNLSTNEKMALNRLKEESFIDKDFKAKRTLTDIARFTKQHCGVEPTTDFLLNIISPETNKPYPKATRYNARSRCNEPLKENKRKFKK